MRRAWIAAWFVLMAAPARATETYICVVFAREEMDIAAEITGVLEDVVVRIGDAVDVGDLLASFRTAPLRQELNQAEAQRDASAAELELRRVELEQASRRVQRRGSLEGAVSQEELAELESAQAAAGSRVAMSEAMLRERVARVESLRDDLARASVRAPAAGTVSVRYVDPGSLVSAGRPLVRLLSNDLWLRCAVPPEVATALRIGQTVTMQGARPDAVFAAVIRQIAPDVDPTTELVFVEADLPDDAEVVVGTVGRVRLD